MDTSTSDSIGIIIPEPGKAGQQSLVPVTPKTSEQSGRTSDIERQVSPEVLNNLTGDWLYPLKLSTWDCLIFLGLGLLNVNDDIVLLATAAISIVFQATFVALVWENLTESDFTSKALLTVLQDWRVTYAHNPEYADPYTSVPLAQAVCERSSFLMEGVQQAQLYRDVDDYIKPFLGMSAGA
jgi:hypothetical protein